MTTIIARTTNRIIMPVVVAVSLYLLWRGHDAPGGGFIAALVAGAALVLRRYSRPTAESRTGSFAAILAGGLLTATLAGLIGIVLAGTMFGPRIWTFHLPGLGEEKLTLSFLFDIGVYLVVIAVINAIIDEIGFEDVDPSPAGEGQDPGLQQIDAPPPGSGDAPDASSATARPYRDHAPPAEAEGDR